MLELFRHTTVRAQAELLARADQPAVAPAAAPTAQQHALLKRRHEQLRTRRGR
jgi:hypothetical protein